MKRRPIVFAAAVGVSLGVLAVLTFFLIRAVVDESHDASRIKTLVGANQERLAEQSKGVAEGLDILCKLKKYDLTTGLPALKARRERGGPEYDLARALVLERALLLVLSIPSAPSCLAAAPPSAPKVKAKPKGGRPLLRELEAGGLPSSAPAQPPSSLPRIEREATTPHRRSSAPAPRPRVPSPSTVTTTTTAPAAAPAPSPAPVATPASPSAPASTTPTSTTPAPAPAPEAPAPSPPPKKHGPLGVCIEALGVEVLC
jgi:hypothetical protein